MDSPTHCIEIPPALAAAIVAAQTAGESLRRDNTGDKGKYTTADEIAFVARKALTAHGAAWVRLDVSLEVGALAQADIGKQAYVGDLVERWAIVHKDGGVLLGSSRMPVITSMGRPHDKAVGASLTYDVGGALRGALCMDREDKNAVDRRPEHGGDDRREAEPASPKPAPKLGPRCRGPKGGPIAKANMERAAELAERLRKPLDKVLASAIKAAGFDVRVYLDEDGNEPSLADLTIPDGLALKAKLDGKLAELEAPAPAGPPGDTDALHTECSKLWVRLCKADPGFHLDDYAIDWAAAAKLREWPAKPTVEHFTMARDWMASVLGKINS